MLGLWKPEMPESIEASRAQRAESNLAENGSSVRLLVTLSDSLLWKIRAH